MKLTNFFVIFLTISVSFSREFFNNDVVIVPETIMKITYENSNRIKAAYYNLESAKYNFKLFESEYTQFNPFKLNNELNMNTDIEYGNDVSLGMQKDFFDGSSVEASIGNSSDFGSGNEKRYAQYVEAEAKFPMFISSRKLNRLIKRTFEENELYSKNLEYVDAIRHNISNALENYYDLVPRYKIYNMLKNYKALLAQILKNKSSVLSADGLEQIQGEIDALESQITGWGIMANSLKINLQRYMAVKNIEYKQVQPIVLDFSQSGYFGEYYITESIDSIYTKALANDTEFKILHIIKKNAVEKKKLAEQGKWDIFANLGTRYYLHESVDGVDQDNYAFAYGGLSITRFDSNVLKHTIAKSTADISAIDYTITDRKNEILTEIEKLKNSLLKKKEQLLSTSKSLHSLQTTYDLKYSGLLEGKESVDVFLQSFRTLVEIEEKRFSLENNYLDTVRDFDYICGVYFEFLEISLD